MAGRMAVGTAYIPEFQEPIREEKRHTGQSPVGLIAVSAVLILVCVLFLVRIVSLVGSCNAYSQQLARSEELRSENTTLTLKMDSLSSERRIRDLAGALGMSEPDPSNVKKVSRKK